MTTPENRVIPENCTIVKEDVFSKYTNVYNSKWPCCKNCHVLTLFDSNLSVNKYKIVGCEKCKPKQNIYTHEEFEKLLRFRNYLSGTNEEEKKLKTNVKKQVSDSDSD